ncbi:hypothetical protein R4172_05645 [Rhodococcus kroppenstedtii]|uniref:hypothetical protein n=1 Tax=Rhodococcoides kroppenstedtii TaxID=293050 RepID=UPI002953E520|nr:hypothetical protein [Rhodococcus kroppenstedtii]MDV7197041.1 hypothetical protein [Rhodococcus kroppenstedtii]
MGLNPNKKHRNLADMTVEVTRLEFERRPEAVLAIDSPIYLSVEGDVLHQKEWHYRGQVVDFALNHYVTAHHPENPGEGTADVARIDCCHSEVHQHQFYRSGRSQDRSVIQTLHDLPTLEEAESVVCACYDDCYLEMANDWPNHLDRWKEVS